LVHIGTNKSLVKHTAVNIQVDFTHIVKCAHTTYLNRSNWME